MQGHHLPAAVKFVDTEVKQACMSYNVFCDKCQHMSTHSLLWAHTPPYLSQSITDRKALRQQRTCIIPHTTNIWFTSTVSVEKWWATAALHQEEEEEDEVEERGCLVSDKLKTALKRWKMKSTQALMRIQMDCHALKRPSNTVDSLPSRSSFTSLEDFSLSSRRFLSIILLLSTAALSSALIVQPIFTLKWLRSCRIVVSAVHELTENTVQQPSGRCELKFPSSREAEWARGEKALAPEARLSQ